MCLKKISKYWFGCQQKKRIAILVNKSMYCVFCFFIFSGKPSHCIVNLPLGFKHENMSIFNGDLDQEESA